MKKQTLTKNEIEILSSVAASQIEDNYSAYDSVQSNEEKGVLGSLVKKGLIYNCYEGLESTYMYCLTEIGYDACKEQGIDTSHIVIY